MVKDKVVISRYADALMKYAQEVIGADKIFSDLKESRLFIEGNLEAVGFLNNPGIAAYDKNDFIDKVFSDDFSQEIRNFMKLLIDKSRFNYFLDIAEYIRVTYSHKGEEEAVLKSAFPLDLGEVKKIKDILEEKFHKKLKFYIELDANILGGAQITMGNKIINGSLKKRLDELKETLKTIRVS
ncbi:MAG: ATP synthase F1 subunit delta [Candidatus Omnitrophota bacterium]